MAYGAILGQMPQIDGIPAVIETYPIATGNTITQGDVVDVVDGQIQRTLTPQANVETVFEQATIGRCSVSMIAENEGFVVDTSGSSGYCRYFKISNNTISFYTGTAPTFDGSGVTTPIKTATYNSGSTKNGIIFYKLNSVLKFKQVEFNGAYFNQTYYGPYDVDSYTPLTSYDVINISDSIVAVFYSGGSNKLNCVIINLTAGVSIGSKFTLSSGRPVSSISATRLPDSGTTRRVCVCYADNEDSNKGKAVIVSIDASNNVTWGSPVVFASAVYGTSCCTDGSDVGVAYSAASTVESLILSNGTSVGPSISVGQRSDNNLSIQKCNAGYAIFWSDSASRTGGSAAVLSRSGTSLTVGNIFSFNSANTNYISASNINENQYIIAYQDAGNSNYGTATILTVSGNQIAGSFLNSLKDAIALQSGTGGQSIEVIYSGITNADWVTEGQTITSTGVYGVGVLDGVLQVWSKDRPLGVQIETGSYTGTGGYGASNPNSLTFSNPVDYIIFVGYWNNTHTTYNPIVQNDYNIYRNPVFPCFAANESYNKFLGPYNDGTSSNVYGKVSQDRKTVYWYNTSGTTQQLNDTGLEYYYIAFCKKGG